MATTLEEFLLLDKKAKEVLPESFSSGAHLALLFDAIHSPVLFEEKTASYRDIDALQFILGHQEDPFGPSFLKAIYAVLTKEEAYYRTHNVHIHIDGHYYFPPSGVNVSKEMEQLFLEYPDIGQGDKERFDDIFAFILKGLLIHPFPNGNGRTFLFAFEALLQRFGLNLAPLLPLDALHNGLYYQKTFQYLFHAGGFYYGQKEINPLPYMSYLKTLLSKAYEWFILTASKLK